MKIACLQFAPKLGDLKGNIARANAILSQQPLEHLDLLVLPELALTGKPISYHITYPISKLSTSPALFTT